MSITPLPTVPQRSDGPTVFADRADTFLAALPVFATEATALEANVNAKEASAVIAASTASGAAAANGATAWVSGTTYAIGNARYSPIDFQTYRRKTAGAGTTDPSLDTTNWARINLVALKTLNGVSLEGAGDVVGIPTVAYDDRADLRGLTPTSSAAYIVEGLGLFVWASGSDEPDDDETCFATTSGKWLLECPSWDFVDAYSSIENAIRDEDDEDEPARLDANFDSRFPVAFNSRVLHGTATSAITSILSASQATFTGAVTGAAVGDRVIATPPSTPNSRISVFARVTATNTVTVYLNNPSGSTATPVAETWELTVIKDI